MKLTVSLGLVFAAACTSPDVRETGSTPAPAHETVAPPSEADRARRLDELRRQLGSNNAGVVTWAAWRCADERIVDVRFDLRKAAQSWGRRENSDTAKYLLDALVRIGSNVTPEEVGTWTSHAGLYGPLLVLASRARERPTKALFAIFGGEWTDETCALRQAAGNILAAERTPAVVDELLDRAVVVVHVEVVDPGQAPEHRRLRGYGYEAHAAQGSGPPSVTYWFTAVRGTGDVLDTVDGRFDGPIDIRWTRASYDPSPIGCAICCATSSERTYSADLLAWLAEPDAAREPFGDQHVTVVAHDLAGGQERVRAVVEAARERWRRVLDGLARLRLRASDAERGREPRVGVDTRDRRSQRDVELPSFADV